MAQPTISKLQRAHAYRLGRINGLLRRRLIAVISQVDPGLSPEQFTLLMRLAENSALTHSDLVDPVLNDRPNITRQIAGLLDRGLVRARADPDDGRRKQLSLTRGGRSLFKRFLPHVLKQRSALFGTLAEDDLAAFERVLSHLEKSLS